MKSPPIVALPPGLAGERWARAVVESIADGFVALDAEWRIIFLNRRGADMVAPLIAGIDDVRGRDFWETFPAIVDTSFGTAFRRARATGEAQNVEDWYAPLDSWFDVRCYPHDSGLAVHFLDIGPRKRAEMALRDSEARAAARVAELEALYREAPLGLGLLDRDLRFVRLNAALAEMNGFNVDAHLGRQVWDLLPDLRASAEPILAAVLATGVPHRDVAIAGETPAQPGVTRHWNEQFYPVRDASGAVIGVGVVCEEVTDKRARAAALAEREALLRASFASAAVGFAQLSPDGRWRHVNPALAAILQYPVTALQGQSFRSITHPDDLAADDEVVARMLAGETDSAVLEKRYLRADGGVVDAEVTVGCVRDAGGAVTSFITTIQDISARKAAEAALQASEARFRGLADNIDQLAWIADEQWEITWYNQRWHDFTGTTLDEVRGWGWRSVHHPDHVDRVVAGVRAAHASGEPWEDTFPLRRHDGEYRWFLSRAQPVRDAKGDVALWFGTNTDVTDQLAREAQVRLLMREVNHRSKNMLAVVHAVARQTLAISPEDFVARFDQRILALAAAHDLLVDSDWRGVDLGALIRSQLAHFGDMIGSRIVLAGPPVRLTSAAGQMIGMAMHELASNAGKYGALRDTEGRVGIGWEASADGLAIEWIERGGPPAEPPARAGFGSRVTGAMTRMALGGQVTTSFAREGFEWRLTAPAARVFEPAPTP